MSNYFCTNNGRDCCCPPSCPPQPCPQEPPVPPRSDCPCREDFRRALDLLCSPRLQPLIDFSAFSFITDSFVLGTALTLPAAGTTPDDNLADPAGSYICGGDSCESLSVSGLLYLPDAGATALAISVTQVALCRLSAVSFDALAVNGDAAANFQSISQILGQLLRPKPQQECTSITDALTSAAVIRASTVTAGPLVVANSTIIGQLGSILVMANSSDNRFYLICANRIGFMG